MTQYHWEKEYYIDAECESCGKKQDLSDNKGIAFRKKWDSAKGEESADDNCLATFCEDCFLRTR